MQTVLAFLLVFGIIVIVHEFGHFYFAKKSGILVREFAIGMGPKIFQTHKNETTYTVRALPLGGYVLMAGYEEEEDIRLGRPALLVLDKDEQVTEIILNDQTHQAPAGVPIDVLEYDFNEKLYIKGSMAEEPNKTVRYSVKENAVITKEDGTRLQIAPAHRQFPNASLRDRMLTNLGGPLNNFLLAILAFSLLAFMRGGIPTNEPLIGDVVENTPAAEAQLQPGDRILSIQGEEVTTFMEMVQLVESHPNEALDFEVERPNSEIYTKTITPEAVVDGQTEVGRIGVSAALKTSFIDKIRFGFTETWATIQMIFKSILLLFSGQFTINDLGGPVAIFEITGEITKTAGLMGLVSFIGLLSVNLGLMNLLPIPALDGGKLLLNVIEGVRGKRISEEREALINLVGMVLLLILMLIVTWNDIQRFFLN